MLRFETEVDPDSEILKDFDLVIACDGINSKFRAAHADDFRAEIETRANHFIWYGTHQRFDAFNFIFKETEHGWIWAHAYQFDKDTATFIVECGPETFARFGFAHMSQEESSRLCEEIFRDHLSGNELMTNAAHMSGSAWLQFRRVLCGNWRRGDVILLGDAAHTAHFSIGSGTKLALEDAIELAKVLSDNALDFDEALTRYYDLRQLEALKLQSAARNSTSGSSRSSVTSIRAAAIRLFALTRSQRVSHENLRLRDPTWLSGVETWFSGRAIAPMFAPFKLRGMELANRIVVSPMAMYSAIDGVPTDFHLVHYGARALGGAGLVYTEMTCVSPEGRITPACPGLWNDAQEAMWRRIAGFVHEYSGAKICLQLRP